MSKWAFLYLLLRHFSEQYLTSSQFLAQLLRHTIGLLQQAHIFEGRPFDLRNFNGVLAVSLPSSSVLPLVFFFENKATNVLGGDILSRQDNMVVDVDGRRKRKQIAPTKNETKSPVRATDRILISLRWKKDDRSRARGYTKKHIIKRKEASRFAFRVVAAVPGHENFRDALSMIS